MHLLIPRNSFELLESYLYCFSIVSGDREKGVIKGQILWAGNFATEVTREDEVENCNYNQFINYSLEDKTYFEMVALLGPRPLRGHGTF